MSRWLARCGLLLPTANCVPLTPGALTDRVAASPTAAESEATAALPAATEDDTFATPFCIIVGGWRIESVSVSHCSPSSRPSPLVAQVA